MLLFTASTGVYPADDKAAEGELPVSWLILYGLNPDDPDTPWQDPDGDGLSNWVEHFLNTDPTIFDTPGTKDERAMVSPNASGGAGTGSPAGRGNPGMTRTIGTPSPNSVRYVVEVVDGKVREIPLAERGNILRKGSKGKLSIGKPPVMSLMSMSLPSGVSIESRSTSASNLTTYGNGSLVGGYASPQPTDYGSLVTLVDGLLGGPNLPSSPQDTYWSNSLPDAGQDPTYDSVDSRIGYIDSLDFVPDGGPYEASAIWNRVYDFRIETQPGEFEETYTFDLYVNSVVETKSGAWKDVRLRTDEPSATDTTVHFHVLREDGSSYVDALTIAAGNQTPRYSTAGGVSGVLQLRPALVLMQGKTLVAGTPEIIVDSTHLGQIGAMVRSTKGSSGERHFVTPKKNDSSTLLDLDHVLVRCQAIGASGPMTSAEFDADYDWVTIPSGKGTVTSDKSICKIDRTAAEKIVVQVKRRSTGLVVSTLNVWVVWAEKDLAKTGKLHLFPSSTQGSSPVYRGGDVNGMAFIFTIKPADIITGFNASLDVPDLDGPSFLLNGTLLGSPAVSIDEESATDRWDMTRVLRAKMKCPRTPPTIVNSDFSIDRGSGLALAGMSSSFPGADVEYRTFPTDKWKGNDDPDSIQYDDGNPYTDTKEIVPLNEPTHPNPKPAIGQIGSYDRPTAPGIKEMAGADDEEVEAWMQFEEFARLELGETSSAKWYVISERVKWESIKRFKKNGSPKKMNENGSSTDFGHSTGY